VWTSSGSFGTDTSGYSIQSQRYASDGSPLGAEFQVNTAMTGKQFASSLAAAANGDFVVVWQDNVLVTGYFKADRLFGQRYASDGSPLGAEFQITTGTGTAANLPSVAAAPGGDFVVVWQSYAAAGTDTYPWSIRGRRFASDGSAQGTEFQVNTYTTDHQVYPEVTAAPDGDFVVAWLTTYVCDPQSECEDYTPSIHGQRYASDGSAQGAEFQVNTYPIPENSGVGGPSVAATVDGGFLVAWSSAGSLGKDTSGWSIQGRRYASDGSAQGAQFQVNAYTTHNQVSPLVAPTAGDDFVAVWTSDGSFGTDTSNSSIQARRFGVLANAVPSLSPGAAAAAAFLLLLAAGFAMRGRIRRTVL
jgi:hypothetical protein